MAGLSLPVAAPSPVSAVVSPTANSADNGSPAVDQPFANVLQQKINQGNQNNQSEQTAKQQNANNGSNGSNNNASESSTDAQASNSQTQQSTDKQTSTSNTSEAGTAAAASTAAEKPAEAPVDNIATLLPWLMNAAANTPFAQVAQSLKGNSTLTAASTAAGNTTTESTATPGLQAIDLALLAQTPATNAATQSMSNKTAVSSDSKEAETAFTGLASGNNKPGLAAETATTAANVAAATATESAQAAVTTAETPQITTSFEASLAAARNTAAANTAEQSASQGTHSNRIDSPLGSAAWNNELGEHVSWMSNQHESKAELVLNPPQLGRIEISLNISGDQANATFISANPQVREALENAMVRLRDVLAESGISLGQTQVGADSSGFFSAQDQKNGDNPSRGAGNGNTTELAGGSLTSTTGAGWTRQGNAMVDVFA